MKRNKTAGLDKVVKVMLTVLENLVIDKQSDKWNMTGKIKSISVDQFFIELPKRPSENEQKCHWAITFMGEILN